MQCCKNSTTDPDFVCYSKDIDSRFTYTSAVVSFFILIDFSQSQKTSSRRFFYTSVFLHYWLNHVISNSRIDSWWFHLIWPNVTAVLHLCHKLYLYTQAHICLDRNTDPIAYDSFEMDLTLFWPFPVYCFYPIFDKRELNSNCFTF